MIPDIELLLSEKRFTSYPHTEYFSSLSLLSIKVYLIQKFHWLQSLNLLFPNLKPD